MVAVPAGRGRVLFQRHAAGPPRATADPPAGGPFLGLLRVAFWLGLENHLHRLGILGGPIIRIWIVAVAMASGLFIPSLGRRLRAALLGLAAFILLWPLVYLRDWASGWLPALVGAIVVGLLWVWKVSTRAAVFTYLMVVLSGPLFYVIARGLAQDDVWSLDTRIIALRGLTTLLEGRWWPAGPGPGRLLALLARCHRPDELYRPGHRLAIRN